jgi:hypothetical protein
LTIAGDGGTDLLTIDVEFEGKPLVRSDLAGNHVSNAGAQAHGMRGRHGQCGVVLTNQTEASLIAQIAVASGQGDDGRAPIPVAAPGALPGLERETPIFTTRPHPREISAIGRQSLKNSLNVKGIFDKGDVLSDGKERRAIAPLKKTGIARRNADIALNRGGHTTPLNRIRSRRAAIVLQHRQTRICPRHGGRKAGFPLRFPDRVEPLRFIAAMRPQLALIILAVKGRQTQLFTFWRGDLKGEIDYTRVKRVGVPRHAGDRELRPFIAPDTVCDGV